MFPSTASLNPFAAPDARDRTAFSSLTPSVHAAAQTVGRALASFLAALALLVTISSTYADGAPLDAPCSPGVSQGLARVGGWAEAQCALVAGPAVPLAPTERCTDAARAGLGHVGVWAEAQCESVTPLPV